MSVFIDQIVRRWEAGARICVGLDLDCKQIPRGMTVVDYFKETIADTHDLALAYKYNLGYWAQHRKELDCLVGYQLRVSSEVPAICDGKHGDVLHTAAFYAQASFAAQPFSAATVNSFFGTSSLLPFLNHTDKSTFVMCRESDDQTGQSGEFTDLIIKVPDEECRLFGLPLNTHMRLYELIAFRTHHTWRKHGDCHLVVGATEYEALKNVRRIIGDDVWLLCPGFGRQGADPAKAFAAGLNRNKRGMIPCSSRSIAYAGGDANHNTGRRSAVAIKDATQKIYAAEAAL